LEVVAPQPPGYVDHLADEVEAGDLAAHQGAGVEFGGVDAAGGDLGLGIALGAGGGEAPGVEGVLEAGQCGVGEGLGWMDLDQRSARRAGKTGRRVAARAGQSRRALGARSGAVMVWFGARSRVRDWPGCQ